MVDEAEADRAVIGGPAAVVLFEKTDRLASQRFADVDRGALPADLAIVAHASDGAVLPIVGLAQNAVEVPRRCDVMVGRRVVAESLVRALIIVQGLEGTKALELLSQAARRRIGGVLQQRQMQPLQSSVLLRFGRCNALRHDPGLDDLDRQLRQSACSGRGKGRAIVGAQPMRKAELAEGRIEHRPDMIAVGARHHLAAQEITAVAIAQRQWLAMRAIAGQEPAFEINAPHIIGGPALCKGHVRRRTATAHPTLDRQALAVEQRPNRAGGRPSCLGSASLQPRPHLHRSPRGMGPAYRQAALGELIRHRLRVMQWRPRAVDQTLNACLPVASKPLVAGPPAHLELPTQRRHRLFLRLYRQHEPHPLIHGTGLPPSHRQGPPCRSVDLLPMSPVYSVTHVAGLDPMRDLTRGRGAAVEDLRRKRQQVSAFLLRQGLSYAGKKAWTNAHMSWLASQKLEYPEQRIAFEEMLLAVRQAQERIERLEEAIRVAVPEWSLAEVVTGLMALRGLDLISATAFLAEIGDLSRFRTPRELMAYLGLVPSEHSTGDKVKRGPITKAGNRRARRTLVECSWSYQHPPRIGKKKQEKVAAAPPAVREIAWKAQCRLNGRYRMLIRKGKLKTVAVTAIARELAAFIWAINREIATARAAAI